MTSPTAAEIREWSKVDFGALGYADDDALQLLIDRSAALFTQITFRPIDASLPTTLETVVNQVVQRMTEILAFQSQQDFVETLSDFQLISSFTAGPYSETRRSLTEIKEAKMLTADPALNTLLMTLLTPDAMDFWLGWWSGENPPAFEVTEVDWTFGSGFDTPWRADPYGSYADGETGATVGPWSW